MLPQLPVIYCSDNAGFPYGLKEEAEVVERTSHYLRKLTDQYKPALAIIACNTASTISLPRVRQELDIPVVGVVPAIKTASEVSRNRCIGLLATPGTVNRDYTDQLIQDFADDCDVIRVGSNALVRMAEQHLRGEIVDRVALKEILQPFFASPVTPDTIVLGCTHFPLLKGLLNEVVPAVVCWVDSGEAIARRVCSLLGKKLQDESSLVHKKQFVYTGESQGMKCLIPFLTCEGFGDVIWIPAM